MGYGYLIFKTTIPLTDPEALSDEVTLDFENGSQLRQMLTRAFPGINWYEHHGVLTTEWGRLEFMLAENESPGKAISVSTSFRQGRNETEQFLQAMCSRFHWTVFDSQEVKLITWQEE